MFIGKEKRQFAVMQRIFISIMLLLIYRMLSHITVPCFVPDYQYRLDSYNAIFQNSSIAKLLYLNALGLSPYYNAAVIVLLLSGPISKLHRLRDGYIKERKLFDRIILFAVVPLAVLQSLSLSISLDRMGVLIKSPSAIVLYMLFLALGTIISVLIIYMFSRYGICNGLVAVVIVKIISNWLNKISTFDTLSALNTYEDRVNLLMSVLFFCFFLVVSCCFIKGARSLELFNKKDGSSWTKISINMNFAGGLAMSVVFFLSIWITERFFYGNIILEIIIFSCLMLIILVVLSLIIFNTKWFLKIIDHFGLTLSVDESESQQNILNNIRVNSVLVSFLFFIFIYLLNIFFRKLEFDFAPLFQSLCGMNMFLLLVLIDEVWKSVSDNADFFRERRGLKMLATLDTHLECVFLKESLIKKGFDVVSFSNRAVIICGTEFLWKVFVPRLPFILIHRRLGGGDIRLFVPEAQYSDAKAFLGKIMPI